MKFDNQVKQTFLDDKPIDYGALINDYLLHWKWFLLSVFVCLVLAFLYLFQTPNQYQVSTTILLNDRENGMMQSSMSAFQDLGIGDQKTSLETEVTVLKSRTLIQNSIKKLGFNQSYKLKGKIVNKELYARNAPFRVNFLVKDSIYYVLDTSFSINAKTLSSYYLKNGDGDLVLESNFGDVVNLGFGEFVVTPNHQDKIDINKEIIVTIRPLKKLSDSYMARIEIEPESKKSYGLVISLKDQVQNRARDILNELVKQYNINAIEDKSLIATNTDKFISQRIEDISKDLEQIDRGVENYKKDNRLTDIQYESGLILESNSLVEKTIVDLTSQINLIDYIIDYMDNNRDDLIPSNLGLKDEQAGQSSLSYNQLLMERNRIIKGSSKMNPTVINLEAQIATLRQSIERSLINSRKSLSFSLSEARSQEARLNAKRAKAPKQEREFQDIKRRQQIIETLYLYLLEKREENAIKLTVLEPNAKVLDFADGPGEPVSPRRKLIYVVAVFFGLGIPFVSIQIFYMLDNKIHSLDDLEAKVKSPIIGDIPSVRFKKNLIISENDNSNVAEAFRLLRTNMSFMLSGSKGASKIIFVTSTIAGEGKSFVTINLAISLGLLDKKVLIIGSDLRKPKIAKYMGLKSQEGVSNYLMDNELEINDLIVTSNHKNLDVIQSGVIPPNASELLMNGRFEKLLAFGKENYDYVIVDTAPVSIVTDTLQLAYLADLFVYVIRANYLDKRLLKLPNTMYEKKQLQNMALLLNDVNHKKKGYSYGYQ